MLRLLQPCMYLEVPLSAKQSYESASANLGQRVFEMFCHTEGVMGVARMLRNALNASDTASSFLQDVADLLRQSQKKVVKAMCGRTVFKFKWQRWYIGLGADLCGKLVSALAREDKSVHNWMLTQIVGKRPFPIARVGRVRRCAAPGCTRCRLRVVMIARDISQLACRLSDAENPDLAWPVRACRGADNSHAPRSVRRSAGTTSRRFVRGSPTCDASWGRWPGEKASKRPATACNAAEPKAEPSDMLPDKVVAPVADLGPNASQGDSGQSATVPPKSADARLRGIEEATVPPAPGYPSRAMGLPVDAAPRAMGLPALKSKEVEPAPWWEVQFEMGGRRFDAQYSVARHALFELFVRFERALGTLRRFLLRGRANPLCTDRAAKIGPVSTCVALETAFKVIPLTVPAGETDRLLRAYVVEIPDTARCTICLLPELLGRASPRVIEPLGVLPGMISASATRASYSERVEWFPPIDWSRIPPATPSEKVSDEKSLNGLEAAVNETVLDRRHGLAPAQPDDHSRVWGVNSFARLPAFCGKAPETAAQLSGFRMPHSVKEEKCAQSDVSMAMSDYGASLTVPGAQKADVLPGGKKRMSRVEADAVALGMPSKPWFAERTHEADASQVLAESTLGHTGSFELGRGFKRSSSRSPHCGPRVSALFPGSPSCVTAPAWMSYKILLGERALSSARVAPRCARVARRPVRRRLRVPVCCSCAVLGAVVGVLLVFANRVAREQGDGYGGACVDPVGVLVVRGTGVVCSVGVQLCVKQFGGYVASRRDRERRGGRGVEVAPSSGWHGPGLGGTHFVLASDCFAWSCRGGSFSVGDRVSDDDREGVCAQLVEEWECLEAERSAGNKSTVARWIPGRPARFILRAVGGGRLLGVTPELVLRSLREAAVANYGDVRGLLVEYVDALGKEVDRLAQRAKTPSTGGTMHVYSSACGK